MDLKANTLNVEIFFYPTKMIEGFQKLEDTDEIDLIVVIIPRNKEKYSTYNLIKKIILKDKEILT